MKVDYPNPWTIWELQPTYQFIIIIFFAVSRFYKVVPGIEPGLLDSKTSVLTIGLYDHLPTAGLEPAISGLEDRRLIHWATRAFDLHIFSTTKEGFRLFWNRTRIVCF